MTSFPLYPHSYSVIPSIHHQNIHRIHQNNSYHRHYLIYLVSRSTHLGTRFPLYIILYGTSFISMTSFPLYPHSYSIIPSIHHQNIHRIHQNNSNHHHDLIYLVSRSTHLGTRYPLYIILYSTSFISMTSFTVYPHSYSIIPFIHHQNIHCIHLNNSYHQHYLIYLVSRSTHLGTRYPLYIILYSTSFISMTSFPLYPHSYSVIPVIHHQNIPCIHLNNSYHHHYLIYLVSRSTYLGTRSSLYIILYSTSFISMTSFPLYPHSYGINPFVHHQNIHRIHLNDSYHHHYLIYLVSRSTHLGTRYPLYIILYSTSFISMTSFTPYPHSYRVIPIHSSTKHSPHSPE